MFLASSDSDLIRGREEQKTLNKKDKKVFLVSDENHSGMDSGSKVLECYSCQNDKVESCKTEVKCENGCSRVNANTTAVGALRYALHLRFICPLPKRRSISVRESNPSLASQRSSIDTEEHRRFYLYDDLKVVFPQRHSDADEGKVWSLTRFRIFLRNTVKPNMYVLNALHLLFSSPTIIKFKLFFGGKV